MNEENNNSEVESQNQTNQSAELGSELSKQQAINLNPSKFKKFLPWVIVGILLLVIILGAVAWKVKSDKENLPPLGTPVVFDESMTPEEPTEEFIDENAECVTPVAPIPSRSEMFVWQAPKLIEDFDFKLIYDRGDEADPSYIPASIYNKTYEVGKVVEGQYKGGVVYLIEEACEGPCPLTMKYFVSLNGKFYHLAKYDNVVGGSTLEPPVYTSKVVHDKTFSSIDFGFPAEIAVAVAGRNVVFKQKLPSFFDVPVRLCKEKFESIATVPTYGALYTDRSFTGKNGFYLVAPGNLQVNYELSIDVLNSKGIPQVNWTDSGPKQQEYTYQTVGGCGASNYRELVDESQLQESDLITIGTTISGEKVYAYKDSNHQALKDKYEISYWPDGIKPSYAEYIKERPYFFWRDPLDRLIRFTNKKFMPLAECAKPVIYLYPTKTQAVSVKVSPPGGLTKTVPDYGTGWNVTAEPNGLLTNKVDGQEYPYLFWEGRGGLYQTPTRGWVVPKSGVESLVGEKLTVMGLNTQERKDFLEYWLPYMQDANYYFITFMDERALNELAPLQISPKPDKVIRVLMDFTPLDEMKTVQPLSLKTPQRTGFTVVEWGGVKSSNNIK